MQLRAAHPAFRRRRFFAGDASHGGESELGDIAWFQPDGAHMDEANWSDGSTQQLMVFLNGGAIPEPDPRGEPQVDDSFLLLLNASGGGLRVHPAQRGVRPALADRGRHRGPERRRRLAPAGLGRHGPGHVPVGAGPARTAGWSAE